MPSLFHKTLLLSMPRMARFILQSRQVVWLLSCTVNGNHTLKKLVDLFAFPL
jgi:hypothetical protein